MKIAYVTPYEGEREIVNQLLSAHEVIFVSEPVRDSIPEEVCDADVLSVFVDSKVTAAMMERMPNLTCVALRSTGYDHVDLTYAKERGIVVTYVPHYGSQTVAEFTFSLILALSRKAYAAYDALRHHGDVDVKTYEGFDLYGKTIGVIGTGAIGQRVCRIAKGFAMNVMAYDVYPNESFGAECGVTYVSLEKLLSQSDIVSLHVPSSAENRHLINETSLANMKAGAYLINTARGDLVDTVALTTALKSGKLAGAGLDVFEGEQYIKDEMELLKTDASKDTSSWQAFVAEHELLDLDNVIMTPHIAFNSVEAKREITETTVANITAAEAGTPQNIVLSSG